jgi:predicted O-linked N-acetylglucosamine transferase (SPINDLY family)
LPVLTLIGTSFAARVAASLLNAVGLAELVTADPIEYEELAVALARNPARLSDIRQRLGNALPTAALFDTRETTMHIEAAYAHIHAGYVAGKPLADVCVREDGRCSDQPREGS